jgi:ligand-binding sensor domain-containing protein
MPKNQLDKDELKVRVLKLKNQLHTEHIRHDMDMKGLAHKYLNEVLDIIDEYRY